MAEVVEGKLARIRFDGARCIHSRNCVLGLPAVFKANVEGPWIDPDGAAPEELFALAERCPSGAVVVELMDGRTAEAPSGRNVVALQQNGPLAVRGDLRVRGEKTTPRATLCRCGASKNKPYCDHSHADAGFEASGEVPARGELGAWGEAGPLEITPLQNGPLKVAGSMEITCASGRTIDRTGQAFLCRCGASGNKPFCDGSHRAAGFTAE